jgi:opacity protein-like surface antigen
MKQILFCVLLLAIGLPARAQQSDINRYTLYTGFDYFTGPGLSMTQRGFDTDFGFTAKTWLGLGVDFSAAGDSIFSGGGTINGASTVYAPGIAAANQVFPPTLVPTPNQINVSFRSTTYTIAAGPQIYIRKWKKVTFLVRPGLGAIHASADLNLPPQLGQLFGFLEQQGFLKPTVLKAHQTDTTFFAGAGGGFDINVSRRVALRVTADWINAHLFSDVLSNRQNYVRLTIGPAWRWGHLQ